MLTVRLYDAFRRRQALLVLTVASLSTLYFLTLFVRVHHLNWQSVSAPQRQFAFVRSTRPFYRRRHPFDCAALFAGDKKVVQAVRDAKTTPMPDLNLVETLSNCSSVRQRHFYNPQPLTTVEAEFPLAFAILVNQDLEQVELLLATIYAPQNHYCFHVDLKASHVLHKGIEHLTACFPNVFLVKEEFPVYSTGNNMMRAYVSCLRDLTSNGRDWRYILTLQGHDFPLKTNLELVRVLKLHGGVNDVELLHANPGRYKNHWAFERTAGHEPILKQTNVTKAPPPSGVTLYKGSVATSLSREFAEFVAASPVVRRLLDWLDDTLFGDEIFFSTLAHDEKLGAPGNYPGRCLATAGFKPWVSRFAVWGGYAHLKCQGKWRHAVCVFSVADLPMLDNREELFLNKFMFETDYVAPYCMQERLFNRTYLPTDYGLPLNRQFYDKLASVGYANWRRENPDLNSSEFKCVVCDGVCKH